MDSIPAALADPATRDLYLAACIAVLVLPVIAITWWYHANIRKTRGGRDLMRRQNDVGVSRHPADAGRMLREAFDMGRDIEADTYGGHARQMQHLVYVMMGLWLVVVGAMFGVLIWADEVNRTLP
ncbi:hypothetical protein [Vineibacter terrae]|uniref:hypothetical protein n=1 Tax=Vineibacter terrae TaxID=2586908 RepID=UPI002E31A3D0|nr:hypothetical protein [Vineibacter terrae]HEX2888585.1 hypothetical protein [Vineibacter terrae]